MANYITINSKFKPFSYAEMLAPVQASTEAHQAVENEYADLATKSSVWEELANEQSDPYAYSLYKSYSKDLEEQANLLAKEGLTPTSRQSMLKMKQRYSKDIIPIEQAYARRQALVDEQRGALLKDNTLLFNKDAAMLSLDDLIRNPQLTYQSYSGTTLANQVGNAAKNLAKEMRDNPRKWRSILGNQYFETLMQEGFRPEEIVKVLQKDPNASPILKKLVDDAVASSGIANWNDESTLNRAWDYAGQGLWNAVGDTKYQNLQNQEYLNLLQREQLRRLNINDSEDKPEQSLLSPRLIEGVEGEVSDDVKTAEGLIPVVRDGKEGQYSTSTLAKLEKEIADTKKEMQDIAKIIPEEVARMYDEKAGSRTEYEVLLERYRDEPFGNLRAKSESSHASSIHGLKYAEASKKLNDLKRRYDKEAKKVKQIEQKYDHLGDTPYDRMYIGTTLEELQQKQEKSSFTLNAESPDYSRIRGGIMSTLRSMEETSVNRGTYGLIDSDGDILSYEKMSNILADSDNISIKISGGKDPHLLLVHNGKRYSIKGIDQINKYDKDLKVVGNYLADFTKSGIENNTEIDDNTYNYILSNGIAGSTIPGIKRNKIEGTNYYSCVLHNSTNNDYIKILMDANGNIVADNSLRAELAGGARRDAYFVNMANTGLRHLFGLFAEDYNK